MYIETLIYVYMWLCISLILFDILWVMRITFDNLHYKRKYFKFQNKIKNQILRIENGLTIEKKHNYYLMKKLKKIKYLIVFHENLLIYEENNKEQISNYLINIRPVFIYLTFQFENKDTMKKAYLAYVISKHKIFEGILIDSIVEVLISYMYDDSIYCRENVMRVLYSFGDARTVIRGIEVLEKQSVYYHTKLLTDGLLTFNGNHNDLCKKLWKKYNEFTVLTQVAVINYFRMKDGDVCEDLYLVLCDDKTDDEVKYAVIRYFGKYKFPIAKDILIKFLENTDKDKWEFAALSALALGIYHDEEVEDALRKGLSSDNWYIRLNSAKSLVAMDFDFDSVDQIIKGNDRFASEILQYTMEHNHFNSYRQDLIKLEAQ